jgi:CRP/FNR family cyclic AMP-dependent transcriptional regulator
VHWKVRREFLSRAEIFADLSAGDLKAVAQSCTESTYPDGDHLCRQGERGVAAFLIVSGQVEVVAETDTGPVQLAILGQGSIVGELSIIDGAERVASIRALGEVQALLLTAWSMQGLIRSRPTIAAAMLPIIVRRFRDTAQDLRAQKADLPNSRKSIID